MILSKATVTQCRQAAKLTQENYMHETLVLLLILAKQSMHSCMQSSPDFSSLNTSSCSKADRRDSAVLVSRQWAISKCQIAWQKALC